MDNEPNDFIIHQGVDEENIFILWSSSEWLCAVLALGVLLCFHHIMLGLLAGFLTLYFIQKLRTPERGSKAHWLWRLGFWRGQKALPWAPSAHTTRIDN